MGKSKRTKGTKLEVEKQVRHEPLSHQILDDPTVRAVGRTKTRHRQEDEDFVDNKLSKRILDQARQQQEDLLEEHGINKSVSQKPKTVRLDTGSSRADSESEEEEYSDTDDVYEDVEIDEEDEKALEMFMSKEPQVKRTLADIIMEKITEKQTELQSQMSDNETVLMRDMDERVVDMYKQIKVILSKYRSGKLPKAFKIIPSLANWEQVLYITDPDSWSAAAIYQATRIFASNMNAKKAQRFFNLVLLPRLRDDIQEYKRLNFHLYQAIRKSLFKPAAFFKGILLPLCESGTCTLREALIVASILTQNSIPMLHSAAAILKISEMEYTGGNSIFLRALLDKKYALPYRVIDAVVFHFLGFRNDKRSMPVLWHQCFLTFVQRYKEDISSEQKKALLEVLRLHSHESITPEIRREIVQSKCRDMEVMENAPMDDL